MEIHEGDYVIGYWIGGEDGPPSSDFLMTLVRRVTGQYQAEYRFRYHVDDKIMASKDTKKFYEVTAKAGVTETQMLETLNEIVRVISDRYKNIRYVEIRGDMEKFIYYMAQEDGTVVKHTKLPEEDKPCSS